MGIVKREKGYFFLLSLQLIVAAGLGVMHTMKSKVEVRTELAPVDYVNNATIAAGWETARRRAAGDTKTKIYTISSSSRNPIRWGKINFRSLINSHNLVLQLFNILN